MSDTTMTRFTNLRHVVTSDFKGLCQKYTGLKLLGYVHNVRAGSSPARGTKPTLSIGFTNINTRLLSCLKKRQKVSFRVVSDTTMTPLSWSQFQNIIQILNNMKTARGNYGKKVHRYG